MWAGVNEVQCGIYLSMDASYLSLSPFLVVLPWIIVFKRVVRRVQFPEFILNFILHGYTKETLVTKIDKTDTHRRVYDSFLNYIK